MKTFYKLSTLALALCFIAASAAAQTAAPQVVLSNIAEGIGTVSNGGTSWAGFSELVLIPGTGLLPVKATTNFLSIGFYGGSTVDIGSMVLYKTARSGTAVLSAKKVLLGGKANPSIDLTNPANCPIQPVSLSTPCIIKLDVVKGALSPLNDYYFTIYFSNDSNNAAGVSGVGLSPNQGGLSGYNLVGDQTRIKKNGSLPPGYTGAAPYFLTSVTNQ